MAHRKTSRRQFLRGDSVRHAVSDIVLDGPSLPAPSVHAEHAEQRASRSVGGTYLVQIARRAMATQFTAYLNAGQYANGPEIALLALDLVEQLEDQLTVYRDHSEVSQLNRRAAFGPCQVEEQLFDLLQLCSVLHEQTGGAFDISAAPLSRLWGFHQRQGQLPEPQQVSDALRTVGGQFIELMPEERCVRFAQPGVEINLGAIGKGYALDRCSQQFADQQVDDYLIHGGQSSLLARGTRAGTDGKGWLVSIRHPLRVELRLAEIWLLDQGLATSGAANQFFHFQGKRYGHVLDPRSGYPADNVLSATVLAPNATEADALATAFFVMGRKGATAYCAQHAEVSALLVVPGQRSGSADIVSLNLPPERFRLLAPT